ncbi:hypothetical protein EXIGLDRAFT_782185 [Exidia glandulosa HHB12029]|uniref:Uncharacterized protein n=1 Tax=Exidia glandulosa HHB12029 TaxID=1314781 RepID=A0A165AXQ6_EXIGL|nr:hypothetical protein EXIGLDRAFT_782185 [Exidia glandulosa HHB12029]
MPAHAHDLSGMPARSAGAATRVAGAASPPPPGRISGSFPPLPKPATPLSTSPNPSALAAGVQSQPMELDEPISVQGAARPPFQTPLPANSGHSPMSPRVPRVQFSTDSPATLHAHSFGPSMEVDQVVEVQAEPMPHSTRSKLVQHAHQFRALLPTLHTSSDARNIARVAASIMAVLLERSEEFPDAMEILGHAVLPYVDLPVRGALQDLGDEIAGLKAAISAHPPPAASAPPPAATPVPVAPTTTSSRVNARKDSYAARAASTTP